MYLEIAGFFWHYRGHGIIYIIQDVPCYSLESMKIEMNKKWFKWIYGYE